MDGWTKSISHHFETMVETVTFVGIYIPGCLRWCRISSIHSMDTQLVVRGLGGVGNHTFLGCELFLATLLGGGGAGTKRLLKVGGHLAVFGHPSSIWFLGSVCKIAYLI